MTRNRTTLAPALAALAALLALAPAGPAMGEMVLSQVIVDLMPGKPPRDDIEVWNDGSERLYVSAEPFEIRAPGTPAETRAPAGTPEQSGLLVAPQRLILEPGERRTIRIALIGERPASDRVFRVAIRPVAGPVSASTDALKVFVGYDTLVLARPQGLANAIEGQRSGQTLTLRNTGNTAQELFDGKQCDAAGTQCRALPAKRLYPGATWEQALPFDTPVTYRSSIGPEVRERRF